MNQATKEVCEAIGVGGSCRRCGGMLPIQLDELLCKNCGRAKDATLSMILLGVV